jgi:hypothetical protein
MGCHAYEKVEKEFKRGIRKVGDIIVDVGESVGDGFNYVFKGGLEDDVKRLGRKLDEEIFQPVYEFQKVFFNSLLDDPLYALAMIVVAVTGQWHLMPYINAIKTKSDGGSWGDALKAGVETYIYQQVGASDVMQNLTGNTAAVLSNAGVPDKLALALAQANTAGLSVGTVDVVMGGSFTDGYQMGASTSLANSVVQGAMGYIESKLPEGLSFKQERIATEGEFKGRAVDADGRPVYERGADGLDNRNKPIAGRTAKFDTRPIPKVVQNIAQASLAATIRGEEVTDAVIAGAIAQTYITVSSVQNVLEKIPGVDFSSPDGELFLSYLTPAIQDNVVIISQLGFTEEAAAATANRLLKVVDSYSSDKLFMDTLDFLDNSQFVQDIMNDIDTLRGNLPNYELKIENARVAQQALQADIDAENSIRSERQGYEEDAQMAIDMLQASPDGAFYFKNQDNWNASFDPVTGEVIAGSPADQGYTGFDDYHNTLADQQGYARTEET